MSTPSMSNLTESLMSSVSNTIVSSSVSQWQPMHTNNIGYSQIVYSGESSRRPLRIAPPRTSLRLRWSAYEGSHVLRMIRAHACISKSYGNGFSGVVAGPQTTTQWSPLVVPYVQQWISSAPQQPIPISGRYSVNSASSSSSSVSQCNTADIPCSCATSWEDYRTQTECKSLDLVAESVSCSGYPSWSKTLNLESTRSRSRA